VGFGLVIVIAPLVYSWMADLFFTLYKGALYKEHL